MEEEIKIGVKAADDVVCSKCGKTLPGSEAYCFKGKENEDVFMCSDCKKLIDVEFQKEVENPNYFGAILMGLLAGITAGVLWYLFEILTKMIIGYVAIGVGYLISWAVIYGSGKKRGSSLQLISAIIAFISIFGASYFSALHYINEYVAGEYAKRGQTFTEFLWISPLNSDLLKVIISPMGLLIWGIGIYIAYRGPRSREI